MINETRIKPLNRKYPTEGDHVLYWMQASQRAEYNHALEFAIKQANQRKLPLLVYFGLTDGFPEANERHYFFMVEGLKEVQQTLHSRRIGCVIEKTFPEIGTTEFAKKASLVVCDRGYLKVQKRRCKYVAEHIDCPLLQVESDVVVPIEKALNKYVLDGRDPNRFAGVAWCFGKHDRPWVTRPIFGNVRFTSSEGLRRKFDADLYAARYSQ